MEGAVVSGMVEGLVGEAARALGMLAMVIDKGKSNN
jgi:hypothetical protein